MARRAYLRRGYVIHGFDRCPHRTKLRMTPDADRRCPFECATGMATVTCYVAMSAVQFEACAEMVKWLLRVGGSGTGNDERCEQYECWLKKFRH